MRQVLVAKTAEQLQDIGVRYGAPGQIVLLEKQLAENQDAQGRPLDDKGKAALQNQIDQQKAFLAELPSIHPVQPAITYSHEMILYQGDREIRLLHFGKAHAGRHVRLPACRKDYFPGRRHRWCSGWTRRICRAIRREYSEALDQLDWTLGIPAHAQESGFLHDHTMLKASIAYLNDMVPQVQACVVKGMDLAQTKAAMKLDSHAAAFGPQCSRRK